MTRKHHHHFYISITSENIIPWTVNFEIRYSMFKISLPSQRTLPEDTVSSAKTKETIQDVELQED